MIASKHCNINLLWGELIIEQLSRFGVVDICIAPGSRSTPLVLAAQAAQADNKLECHQHFDERGLAFYALGLAKYQSRAVAIITTSGSAVANLLPAVVEAHQNNTPLIILSADRPPELINCGANQAIEQPGIFSHFARHCLNLPAADISLPANKLLAELERVLSAQQDDYGVLHINCMFREPLYPDNNALIDYSDYLATIANDPVRQKRPTYSPKATAIEFSNQQLATLAVKKILIIVAQREPYNQADDQALLKWTEQQSLPVLIDCQASQPIANNSIHYYDQLLHRDDFSQTLAQSELIVQLGGHLASKRLQQFIANTVNDKKIPYWLISDKQQCHDPDHNVSQRFTCSSSAFLDALEAQTQQLKTNENQAWLTQLQNYDHKFASWLRQYLAKHQQALEQDYCAELSAVALLPKLLPEHSCLFLGNSMAIRLYDMFGAATDKKISIFSNRGASGIDGLLATATGIANKHAREIEALSATTIVLGDTSLLHDLNSLALAHNASANNASANNASANNPFIIIVLNNDGGAIFNMLPTPTANNIRQDYYQLPHGLTFEQAAKMFNINYQAITSLKQFEQSYRACLESGCLESGCLELNSLSHGANTSSANHNVHLLELIVPSEQTTNLLKDLGKKLREHPAL